ncbi:hypothetical protein [Phenylobacterium sp.]|uniref:hypothetical protein n=1 Tax=Phenylobacterium sp. TaxID=1871053 RepID=UPI00272F9C7D|nr:hypothetical protein [Phenylobacterium sp.]
MIIGDLGLASAPGEPKTNEGNCGCDDRRDGGRVLPDFLASLRRKPPRPRPRLVSQIGRRVDKGDRTCGQSVAWALRKMLGHSLQATRDVLIDVFGVMGDLLGDGFTHLAAP